MGLPDWFWLELIFEYSANEMLPEFEIWPVAGQPTSQPGQSEAALPALLEAGSVAVLAAGTDSGHHDAVNVQRSTEGEASVPLRDELELLWET